MIEKIKTKTEIDANKARLLDEYAGPFCGDVFLTARDMFSRFDSLKNMSMNFTASDKDGYMFSARPDPEHPSISINTNQDYRLDDRILQRLKNRFKLADEVMQFFADNPGAARPLILAHELAHVVQSDPLFVQAYGADYSPAHPMPHEDYAGYVMSDAEVNADFIAASIVSNTDYGQSLGLAVPDQAPAEWREWSAERPMLDTLDAFGGVNKTTAELIP